MPDIPDHPEDTGPLGDGRRTVRAEQTGAPRWVKVSGVALLVVLLLMAAVMLLSGGRHGPGRHLSSTGPGAAVGWTAPVVPAAGSSTAPGILAAVERR